MPRLMLLILALSLTSCQASGPPGAPQKLTLEADRGTQRLSISWSGTEATSFDVLIRRSEFMVTVFNDTVEVKPDASGRYLWNWTSVEPLECTSLSVTLRSRDGAELSDWTPPEILAGMDVPSNAEAQMYPVSPVINVGSNTTFCCIIAEGQSFGMITYKIMSMNASRLSRRSYATTRTNQGPSAMSGTNVMCSNEMKRVVTGTVVFVGYPPNPSGLVCETHDLLTVECQWSQGPDTHLHGKTRQTFYTLNGRNCTEPNGGRMVCGLDHWEGNWTLEARNLLGRVSLTDSGEMSHRVRPGPPAGLVTGAVHAWNASLQWQWPNQTFSGLALICQVQMTSNWHTSMQTFTGAGLDTVVLTGLQPDEEYSVKVRCGSQRNFWKWGNWSSPLTFSTKMDRPEAPDVWAWMDSNSTGRVIWKPLTKRESHGQVSEYEVTLWSPEENRQHSKTLPRSVYSLGLSLSRPASGVLVTVTAKNPAGVSPPATLGLPAYLGDTELPVSRTVFGEGGFPLSWPAQPNASCDYVVQWHNATCSQGCEVDWTRVPLGASDALVQSEHFLAGVRYIFSLYSCPSEAPELQQRWEGYVLEQAPSMSVPHLSTNQQGSSVLLAWKEIPLEHQRGFILGYRVYMTNASRLTLIDNITDPSQTNYTVRKLAVGSYKFVVKAYNSAGEDGGSTAGILLESYADWLILEILVTLGTLTFFLALITTACYRKRKWVKKAFYPDIPEPKLPGDWSRARGTMDLKPSPHSMVHIVENPDWDSKEALVTVPEEEEEENAPPDTDSDEPASLRYYNQVVERGSPRQRPPRHQDSSASSASSMDSARTDVTYTGVQVSAPPSNPQPETNPPAGGYRPQMHPASGPGPSEPQARLEEPPQSEGPSGGYQPQCSWKIDSPVEGDGLAPSLGSPTSIKSSQFLLPDEGEETKGQTSWFQNLLSGKP